MYYRRSRTSIATRIICRSFRQQNAESSPIKEFFEYLRDDLEVELQFEIEDLMPVVESVVQQPLMDSDIDFDMGLDTGNKVEDYKWREDVLTSGNGSPFN